MDDFAFQIAAAEKFPGIMFGFEALDPTVLIHHLPMPQCDKCVVSRPVHPVARIFNFVSHDAVSEPSGHPSNALHSLGQACQSSLEIFERYNTSRILKDLMACLGFG